jgi:hypothetical protein
MPTNALPTPRPGAPPRQVLLFSGHLMDKPGRKPPRFPPAMEAAAAAAIGAALSTLGAGVADVAFSQAAAGGDLLFLEACTARGVRCQVLLPFDEASFLRHSVLPCAHGERWAARWQALKGRLAGPALCMPEVLGPTPEAGNPYERCNQWLLDSALAAAPPRGLHLVCLWNGAEGDGPGGTRHMMDEARRHSGSVQWIDTRTL